ncbi:MAG: UPF0755 protein [Parcubacteria group bacterium Gr01-1014_56]|nr:MAG: UPF0755 protein [Parcubacteria group bacterium Gr01-1014_56]
MSFRSSTLQSLLRLWRRLRARPFRSLGAGFAVLLFLYILFFAPPFNFPIGAYVHIPAGSSLSASAEILKDRGIVRSPFLFKSFVYLFGGNRHVVAGEYFFPNRITVIGVAWRLRSGDFMVDPVRVRVLEGATVNDIAELLTKSIPDFNVVSFERETRGKEGYLFPDTYFFMPGEGVEAILGAFANNFSKNIIKVQKQIDAFGKPLSDVIIMASLLEREAPQTSDRRIIAGILWKRIKLGMPLQVDAVFPYIIGKNSYQLTVADLKVDSPYNTYINKGLPPGPIANPGLDAIVATVTPIQTSYLYYLSDRNGQMHYSATYEQHLTAKRKYID